MPEKKIGQNTMQELLGLINNKKIQDMMCNPDVLNSMNKTPDVNKLMNCSELHNVVSDRKLMSQIMSMSKNMEGISGFSDPSNLNPSMAMPDFNLNPSKDIPEMNMPNLNISLDESNQNTKKENLVESTSDHNYDKQLNQLMNMGFDKKEENISLLLKHDGDIKKVLKELL